MRDPIPVPSAFYTATEPLARALHLNTLPLHVHEVLLSFLLYHVLETIVSPYLSSYLFHDIYTTFPTRTKINWDIHFTAFVQSLVICTAVVWVICFDADRISGTWEDRIWGYSGAAGMTQGFATGYFLWDLKVCLVNVKILGLLDLVHALAAVPVAFLGYRPFGLYYGMSYLLFELSTPFVNLHWFFDKVNMTGTSAQLYNGVVLIVTFALCRLLWGSYLSLVFFSDIWTAVKAGPITSNIFVHTQSKLVVLQHSVPWWIVVIFAGSNVALMSLNFYWFSKMIEAVAKRFRPARESRGPQKGDDGAYHAVVNVAQEGTFRRRKK